MSTTKQCKTTTFSRFFSRQIKVVNNKTVQNHNIFTIFSRQIKVVKSPNCQNVCRIVRHLRGRGAWTSTPSLERTTEKIDTFQKQNQEEERIKNRSPKLVKQKEEFSDERVNKLQNFIFALGKRIEHKNLASKIQYFPSVSKESKRCSDLFYQHNNLDLVSGLKEEHRKIGQAFQSLSEHWKSVRIKSDNETKQIQVVTSLKLDPDEELLNDIIEEMKSKIDPLCTSLFLVTSQALGSKHNTVRNLHFLSKIQL